MPFAPPKVIETTVFAHLPDELKLREGTRQEWVESQPRGGPTRSLLEGPSIDKDGNLYCVDLVTGRVLKVTADGVFHVVAEYDGWPNGLKIHQDGLYVQLSGGTGPDGLALDDAGRLVVAHVGFGAVWVFDPKGEPLYRIDSRAGAFTTNVAFGARDRNTLYITESESATILRAWLDISGKPMYSHQ